MATTTISYQIASPSFERLYQGLRIRRVERQLRVELLDKRVPMAFSWQWLSKTRQPLDRPGYTAGMSTRVLQQMPLASPGELIWLDGETTKVEQKLPSGFTGLYLQLSVLSEGGQRMEREQQQLAEQEEEDSVPAHRHAPARHLRRFSARLPEKSAFDSRWARHSQRGRSVSRGPTLPAYSSRWLGPRVSVRQLPAASPLPPRRSLQLAPSSHRHVLLPTPPSQASWFGYDQQNGGRVRRSQPAPLRGRSPGRPLKARPSPHFTTPPAALARFSSEPASLGLSSLLDDPQLDRDTYYFLDGYLSGQPMRAAFAEQCYRLAERHGLDELRVSGGFRSR